MEPMHGERHDPGHGAILTRLSAEENAQRVRRAFDGVPLFVGVSNHTSQQEEEDRMDTPAPSHQEAQ
jgi:polysaccharide deacetylase 2 family uncharacterized protein YibQ